jgi:hypothetical protein
LIFDPVTTETAGFAVAAAADAAGGDNGNVDVDENVEVATLAEAREAAEEVSLTPVATAVDADVKRRTSEYLASSMFGALIRPVLPAPDPGVPLSTFVLGM